MNGANVASRLQKVATILPGQVAVASAIARQTDGRWHYHQGSFAELERDSNRIASGLARLGVAPGAKLVLLVRPGWHFVSLVFALLKGGYVSVLVDPGLGWRRIVQCLANIEPDGMIAVPLAHAARLVYRRRFSKMRYLVTVGRRWGWSGWTLDQVRSTGSVSPFCRSVSPSHPASVIFTSGSTGPAKGVLYSHATFAAQLDMFQQHFGAGAGEVDLSTFPLFGLFNGALGQTTVFPKMDFTRPAKVTPENILAACRDWQITQAFGSPALWNTVARYCEQTGSRLNSLRRVFSAGAPVPAHVLARLKRILHPDARIYTPYGATEALPVCLIEADEILGETAKKTQEGAGFCVGRPLPGVEARIIAVDDEPISAIQGARQLGPHEMGELIVRGPIVTSAYVASDHANALHKIADGTTVWHRMGDVGYLDGEGRFWFCGRKSHRVQTAHGTLYTIPCESVINRHPAVYRSALVGVGQPPHQIAAIVAEPWPEQWPQSPRKRRALIEELRRLAAGHPLTCHIQHFFLKRTLPVDIRHNAKIFREQLAQWVARRLRQPKRR